MPWMKGTAQTVQQQRVKFRGLQPAKCTQMYITIPNLVTITYVGFALNANELFDVILKWCLGCTRESQTQPKHTVH